MLKYASSFQPFQLAFARKYKYKMWPAMLLGKAQFIEGYRIYFFRSKDIVDVPWVNVLKNFELLLEHEISFKRNGIFKKGIVQDIYMDGNTVIPKFYVKCKNSVTYEVSFYNVFLSTAQASLILSSGKLGSTTSLFSIKTNTTYSHLIVC